MLTVRLASPAAEKVRMAASNHRRLLVPTAAFIPPFSSTGRTQHRYRVLADVG